MPEYVDVLVQEGVTLLVEVPEQSENLLVEAGRARDVATATITTLSSALDSIKSAASTIFDRIHSMEQPPAEIVIDFSVQLAAEAGVVIASTAANANMGISFRWTPNTKKDDENASP